MSPKAVPKVAPVAKWMPKKKQKIESDISATGVPPGAEASGSDSDAAANRAMLEVLSKRLAALDCEVPSGAGSEVPPGAGSHASAAPPEDGSIDEETKVDSDVSVCDPAPAQSKAEKDAHRLLDEAPPAPQNKT